MTGWIIFFIFLLVPFITTCAYIASVPIIQKYSDPSFKKEAAGEMILAGSIIMTVIVIITFNNAMEAVLFCSLEKLHSNPASAENAEVRNSLETAL